MVNKDWIVVGSYMDGVPAFQVVHKLDERELRSGSYWGGIVKGLSMNKAEMEKIAEELNVKNEPAPENKFRGAFR
jgi:hypothetical protein